MENQQQKKIRVYYDGLCNLCAGIMDNVEKSSKGGIFEHKDITKGELPQGMSLEEAMHDVHVVDEAGRMHKGADAVLKMFEYYPHLTWLATLGRLPGVDLLAAAIYRIIEKTRYWIFGRKGNNRQFEGQQKP